MMYVGKCLIVGKVSLQLAVGIFCLGTLSPTLLALAFHLGIVRLEHTAGGLIELVTEVSRGCQSRQKLIVGLEVAKEAMTLVVVIALGKQFYRVSVLVPLIWVKEPSGLYTGTVGFRLKARSKCVRQWDAMYRNWH